MKDTSRPHPTPSRSAPYKKRKTSGPVSPPHGTRRAHDASQPQGRMTSSHSPDRVHSLRRREARSRAIPSEDDERRSLLKSGGAHNVVHARTQPNTDGLARDRHVSGLSTHADVPGPSLRLPPAPAPPATHGPRKAESPPPGSVTAFLRSIELPDAPCSTPPRRTSSSAIPPSLRPAPLSTDNAKKEKKGACTNGNDYQVSLVYKGYPFTYDLSALPDDPKGTIALLTITKSDPGAYILVGAHYRRTGRSRAARAVIRSLLDNLDSSTDVEKEKGDAAPITVSDTSTTTLPCLSTPCPKLTDRTMSVFKGTAMRPALLLLAACELDISREHPDDPESDDHASTAHEIFRTVFGIANDALDTGAGMPEHPKRTNALGLEFASNRNCPSVASEVVPLARVQDLERELSAARGAHKTLQDKLAASNDRLTYAEDKVRALESHTREMLVQLGASRDENWELRQQLAESEQRARELVQCTPSAENRVWGRLKDLLFDNLGGVRGE